MEPCKPGPGLGHKLCRSISCFASICVLATADQWPRLLDLLDRRCGPCKMIAPELERLANELDPSKVVFAKMDCGADNESKK